ncbi:MAG TPA: SpoIIE family protein phosphatase [Terriglobales bacterium]|nr:SpoIIE family protein phosphatase [Terriglobales bacterium]
MSHPSTATPLQPGSVPRKPKLICEQSGEKRVLPLSVLPFTIGRKPDKDLVIADPRVSREHARIELIGIEYWIVDLGSKHGTFVNGVKIERQKLKRNDRLEFGARDGAVVTFDPEEFEAQASGEWFKEVVELETSGASDLEKLSLFLDAVRKLNATNVLDEVLVTLLEATLRLTRADRAFVFLRDRDGRLKLTAGRDSRGHPLTEQSTISHSILNEAASGGEFLITDTSRSDEVSSRNSIVAFDLRTVICLPLCRTGFKQSSRGAPAGTPPARDVMGVLYLDSHFASRDMSAVSHDALRAIATEAAALVENASLVEAEEAARLYQQELTIAASIQQNLMAVTIPDVPFARIRAKSVACKDIGGDFYDVVRAGDCLTVIVADVCGKGISAALLASTLQGMVYSQLEANVPLAAIARSVNDFFCQKRLGEKYATIIMAQLRPDGTMEFINCGHVPPVLVCSSGVSRPRESNLPVGLIPGASYESARCELEPGDKLILLSDGVTEAANAADEFFGDDRLENAASSEDAFGKIVSEVAEFCGATPNNDDCTILELKYTGN